MVGGVFNASDQIADIFWAGRVVGFQAIGGVGVAQAYGHLIMMARMGLDVGMQAVIARAVGARRIDLANHAAMQAFTLTFLVSLILAIAGVALAPVLLQVLGISPSVVDVAVAYLQYQFISSGVQSFRQTTGAALQASGDALTPMKSTITSRLLHLIFTPFLIFGWLGLPDMGIAGAAAANAVSQLVGVAWNLHALGKGSSRLHLRVQDYRLDFPLMWRIIRIGAPATATQMERGLSEMMLIRLVTPFGDIALAAYSLTRRLERMTNIGSQGMGRASGVLVGQNLGAGLPERAKLTVKWAVGYVMVIRGFAGVLLILFPAFFISLFSHDAQFVAAAIIWLRIQAVAGTMLGGGQVFQQSFNVAGDTLAPMYVTFMSMWVMEIPLAFALSRWTPAGAYGIAIAIAVAMLFRFLLYGGYYLTGRWTRARVLEGIYEPGPTTKKQ
jgi:putative MATE family efflux protein